MKSKGFPLSKQIAYSFGQIGRAMLCGIMGTYLMYFYIPSKESGIDVLIPQKCYMGFISLVGIITMSGRIFDALSDPVIANISDRCRSSHGRRIPFMRLSAFPYALFTALVFWTPIHRESYINGVYLFFMMLLYYIFVTLYSTPYNALMAELGHTAEDKVNISTLTSIGWFIGFAASTQAPVLWKMLQNRGIEKIMAMRGAFTALCLLAAVFLMIPVIAIDEKRYSRSIPCNTRTMESVKRAFKNREFKMFTFSFVFYNMANTIFQSAMLYYVTVLLGKSEDYLGTILALGGISSLIFYYPINVISKRIGKKKLLIAAFCIYTILYGYGFYLGSLPISIGQQICIMVLLSAPSVAIFSILPCAAIGDIAHYEAFISGESREGMIFGAKSFLSKLGNVISTFIVSGLLLLDVKMDNHMGVRLTAAASAVISLIGLAFVLSYNEKKVLESGLNKAE